MADIVLAEHRGQTWLVSGEQYIDDLLANTLPGDISIEFIACQSDSDITVLWVQSGDQPASAGSPWIINPAIVSRIRRNSAGLSVFFGQWSVLLDDDAHSVIRASAARAMERSDADVMITSYVGPEGPRIIADLANLRCNLIEAELAGLGVASSRIVRVTRDVATVPGMGAESQRIDIVVKMD